ncbi:TrbC/VirB2 family protein [Candidatus Williamhamiltonella defendens]|uniref:TrbC/VirB2 family protein n=1 Tax=Candidatus Williamhamiltonella defendens TaxID=138072 RepID=UPI0003022561|nr:TrbC/VirB2 family protein [Candidatus Hamiltonella defensa]CED78963.1 Type IV secretion system protein VirB2 [Candidatus Hamiltonella defensa (Bemisia tabaci)]
MSNQSLEKSLKTPRFINHVTMAVMLFMASPWVLADWKLSIKTYSKDVQVALYAVAAVCALITLTWVGIKWLISRSNGDMETTLMDYFKQICAVSLVGGVILIGTAAWQFFGGTGL